MYLYMCEHAEFLLEASELCILYIMMLQFKCISNFTLVVVSFFWTLLIADSNMIKSIVYRFSLNENKKCGGTSLAEKAVAGIIDCNRLCKLLGYSASEYKDGNCKLFTDQPTSYEDDQGSTCSTMLGKRYLQNSNLNTTHSSRHIMVVHQS